MAFVRALNALCRDKKIGKYVVPIVPDESRTFGMEGMFRQLGIYNPKGQLYTPQDADQLSYYKESKDGQVLQEGINEAGAMADWIAAATTYSVHGVPMIPFYIYYSMFGFQRIGDLAWAAGDSRARGFMLGGTAGRTTLNGEGLQHQDGHSHILAGTIPNCITYDPSFGYEIAVIIAGRAAPDVRRPGGRLLLPDGRATRTTTIPAMPEGVEQGIVKGLYRFSKAEEPGEKHVNLMSCGTIFQQAMQAAEMLRGRLRHHLGHLGGDQPQRTGPRGAGRRAVEPDVSDQRAEGALRHRGAEPGHRAGDRGDRLHEELRRADPAPSCRSPSTCSAPTASAARTAG